MQAYETTATVSDHGQVHLAGIPFAPGTEVAVTIREKVNLDPAAEEARSEHARARMRELFARVRARNTEPIGPLNREELYDRKVLR
jgi:hypothetical protein